jgi:uncharacterized membrane protein (UPF0127 family)
MSVIMFFPVTGCRAGAGQLTDIQINNAVVHAEIADTQAERTKGLMNRKSMPENNGMLFVFPQDRKVSFWMKDTEIPLSIAFISSAGIITQIEDMQTESLDTVKSFRSIRYALEVNQGWFERNNVRVGDKVVIPVNIRANE